MKRQNKVEIGDLVVRIKNNYLGESMAKIGLISKVNGGENDKGHVYYGAWNSMAKEEWRYATPAEIRDYKSGQRMTSVEPIGCIDNFSII